MCCFGRHAQVMHIILPSRKGFESTFHKRLARVGYYDDSAIEVASNSLVDWLNWISPWMLQYHAPIWFPGVFVGILCVYVEKLQFSRIWRKVLFDFSLILTQWSSYDDGMGYALGIIAEYLPFFWDENNGKKLQLPSFWIHLFWIVYLLWLMSRLGKQVQCSNWTLVWGINRTKRKNNRLSLG
jgi:hypothetical protein